MPLIQVLPNTGAAAAPGWAYVPDTGYDPSKVAINPKDRKRHATRPGAPTGNELSARQQTALLRRIAELEKDNDARSQVAVPVKGVPRTPATKKVLMSQKTIMHWLADEEALLQQASAAQPTAVAKTAAGRAKRKLATPTQSTPPITSTTDAPQATTPAPTTTGPELLDLPVESSVPLPPAEDVLATLLAAPPLSYAAARAGPPGRNAPPQRQFCDTCGYWGRIKCLKCGARVCGLECKEAHDGTRCTRF